MMNWSLYGYSFLTLLAFAVAVKISRHWKSILFNSFVLTVTLLVVILLTIDISYDDYLQGNAPLNNLLGISIVALAVPLYEQLHQISRYWKNILLITCLASLLSMLSGAGLALYLGATPEMVATVLPKSVTTPIAMAVSQGLGGIPSIAAVGVVDSGITRVCTRFAYVKKIKSQTCGGARISHWCHFPCLRYSHLHGKRSKSWQL